MSGFFLMTRGITSHHLFKGQPQRLAVWIWLLENAVWKESPHDVQGKTITVPRGSVCTSVRHISSETGVSFQTVRTALKRFEAEHMTNTTLTHGKSLISVCNYDKHQATEKDTNTRANTSATHDQHTTNTQKKQGNKVNNKEANASLDARVCEILSQVVSWDVAQDFTAARREMKKPITERAARSMVKSLSDHHDPDAVIRASITNGWQGIFPEKIKPEFKTINGGQNGKRSITERLYPSDTEVDFGPGGNASQPLSIEGDSRGSGRGGDSGLGQGSGGVFSIANFKSM